MKRWMLALLTCLVGTTLALAQLPPDAAIKSMTAADGLQVELFAAEPMLINPTSMDIDPAGRVWVTEAVNYRCFLRNRPLYREEGDRIQILIDTNGDGKADEAKTFYQGKELIAPLGIAIAPMASHGRKSGDFPCRVFVCQSPDILVFEDKDGDLKADGPPTKFLTGFGGVDHDHGVHGINIGPDGKLYFTVGDGGVKNLQAADGKGPKWTSNTTDVQKGTVWRVDMDGKNLELIAHNFRNNYECCVNSFGEVWLSDNDDDGNQQTRICFVMPGGNYGYGPRGKGESHWHEEQPGIVHKTLRTGFGSPTGITFYEGSLLPQQYRGNLLHTDAGPRELRCFHIRPKGAGYELDKTVMLTSSDNWFRPSDVCVAPDGSVFVADWYDPGVGGHGMGDTTCGRVYRITPKGHQGYKVPEVKLVINDEIQDALASPCIATRTLAFAKLSGPDTARLRWNIFVKYVDEGLVARKQKGTPINQELVARMAWIQSKFVDANTPKSDRSYGVVALGFVIDGPGWPMYMRVWSTLKSRGYTPNDSDAWMPFDRLTDSDSEIRKLMGPTFWPTIREYLIGVERIAPDLTDSRFAKFAKLYDGQDHFYRAALNIACGTDPARRDAILADFPKHFPEWNDKVADLVWELRPKSMMPKLAGLLADAKLTGAQKARIVDILAASDDAGAGASMLKLLASDAPAEVKERAVANLRLFLPTKWNALASSNDFKDLAGKLLDDAKTRSVALQVLAATGDGKLASKVSPIAADTTVPVEVRREAVKALGQLPGPNAVTALRGLLADKALATDAVRALATHIGNGQKPSPSGTIALTYLQEVVLAADTTADLKALAVDSLSGTRAGTDWLLDLKEQGKLPAELVAATGTLLRNSPFQGQRNRALMLFPAAAKIDPKKLVPADLAKRALGNIEKGKAVLAATANGGAQCMKCHTIRGIGGQVGPDLSMVGKKGSRENLFESLLQPSKAIADQYLQVQVTTAAGLTVTGLPVAETATDLTLRDANGKDTVLKKDDIEGRKPLKVSIMPDDIVASLTLEELNDVVSYLQTLQTAALTPDSWKIAGPFPSPGGNAGLDKAFIPEDSETLRDQQKLLAAFAATVGTRPEPKTIRTNAAAYVDLAAFHGDRGNNSVSYALQVVESPVEQEAEILLGTDDGAKLFVNGVRVFETKNTQAAKPGKDSVKVKLKPGANAIVLKIANGNNPHGFYFTILSGQELKLSK